MENSSNISIPEIPWQAKFSSLVLNIRDKIVAGNEERVLIPSSSLKKLTKEATIMIYVMLTFTILAVIGTSITTYGFFLKNKGKKIISGMIEYESCNAQEGIRLKKKNKFIKSKDYWRSFFKHFCLVRNGRKILKACSSEDQIDCIHGLRCVGSFWFILGHVALVYFPTLKDAKQAKTFLELKVSQLLLNMNFPVDIFFVISGFLNAFYFFYQYSRYNGKVPWVYFYFKRLIRLAPVQLIVFGFYTTLYTYTGTGFVWPKYDTNPVCRENWWFYLLYIFNFNESAIECMPWNWQVAVDMQFYVISPLLMIPLKKYTRVGYFLILACIAVSCSATFAITYWFNLVDGLSRLVFHLADDRSFYIRVHEYFGKIHAQPYSNLSSYLVGLALGYFSHKKDIKTKTIRNSKVTLYCGWIVTTIFMWICLFSIHLREENLMETVFYNGTRSLFFSSSMAWIIYVCLTGQAGVLNNCLSWKAIRPFSHLSYCANMVHMMVACRLILLAEDATEFSFTSLEFSFYYKLQREI